MKNLSLILSKTFPKKQLIFLIFPWYGDFIIDQLFITQKTNKILSLN